MRVLKIMAVLVAICGGAVLGAVSATGPGDGGTGGLRVEVLLDSEKLLAFGLTAEDVRRVLETQGLKVTPEAAGRDPRNAVFRVEAGEALVDGGALGEVVLKIVEGSAVRLGVVATIRVVAVPATGAGTRP